MIPLRDQEAIRQRFQAELKSRVRVDFFSQKPSSIFIPGRRECQYCGEVQTLLEEIASLSDRISLTVHDLDAEAALAQTLAVDKVPATVIRGQTNRPIRFFGLPTGTGFVGFIETLLEAASGQVELRPETVRQLRKLKSDLRLQVLVTTSCPYSPSLSHLATRLAIQSNRVKVDVVEAGEFPELVQRFNVRAVPTTIIGEDLAVPGAMEEATLLDLMFKVVEGKPLSGNIHTGNATALAPMRPQQRPAESRSAGGLILPR